MAAKKKPIADSRQVTKHLRELAAEAYDLTKDGEYKTRAEALADILWKKALGYEEHKVDDEGNETVTYHEPAAWAMQLVYDRMEGRVPQSVVEDDTRIKASEQVREIATQRLNRLAAAAIEKAGKKPAGPPKHVKKPKPE